MEKTEQPTEKKKRDSTKKGQVFRSQDWISILVLLALAYGIRWGIDVDAVGSLYEELVGSGFKLMGHDYVWRVLTLCLKISLSIIFLAALIGCLPSLIMHKFAISFEVLKLDFSAASPIQGIKRIFSLRTVKDAIKALLYLLTFVVVVCVFWRNQKHLLLSLAYSTSQSLISSWANLIFNLIVTSALCCLPIAFLDFFTEYFLHIRGIKMSKHEVKQEHKDSEGDPEIKSKRSELRREVLLPEQVKNDVENSKFILSNPSHIAIGIYINKEIFDWPFVSLVAVNARARAIIAYAKTKNVPVVRNISLARAMYRNVRRYSFLQNKWIDQIREILDWLDQVEAARLAWVEEGSSIEKLEPNEVVESSPQQSKEQLQEPKQGSKAQLEEKNKEGIESKNTLKQQKNGVKPSEPSN